MASTALQSDSLIQASVLATTTTNAMLNIMGRKRNGFLKREFKMMNATSNTWNLKPRHTAFWKRIFNASISPAMGCNLRAAAIQLNDLGQNVISSGKFMVSRFKTVS